MKSNLERIFHSQQLQKAIAFHSKFTDTQHEAEVAALTSVLYPQCVTCQKTSRTLSACACCGVVHTCSSRCRKLFDRQHSEHLLWGHTMFYKPKRLLTFRR